MVQSKEIPNLSLLILCMERKDRCSPLHRLMLGLLLIFAGGNAIAADYYWVGGTGNWSQLSHWATTSGGSTFHTAVPTAVDNIIFDGNSFNGPSQTLTFDLNVTATNMTFTGVTNNPTFAVGTRTVTLSGNYSHVSGALDWTHTNTLSIGGNVLLNNSAA